MTLRDYLEILWRRRLVVLLPVLAAAALAAGPSLLQAPAYRSTTTMFFAPRDPAEGTALAGQRLASYVALVSGPRLAQGVAEQLALPLDDASVNALARRLSATAHPDSLLVTLAATGSSPQDAQRLAQAAASQLVQLAASLEPPAAGTQTSPVWLTVAEPAEPGLPLTRSALVQDVVLGLVLGLAVGSGLAFLVEALDPRVVDARSLRRIAPGTVLTLAVPRGGGDDRREEPTPPPGAVRVLRTMLLGRAVGEPGHGARVVLVTGSSVGDATRTVAHWIGTALSRSGRKVLLLRADEQDAWEAGGPPGIAQVLAGQVALDALPVETLDGGPWLLRAGSGMDDAGELLAAPGMADVVRQLTERFDHVVLEAPPVLPYVESALLAGQCADQVVLVVRPGWSRRRPVRSAVAVLARQDAPVTLSVLTRFLRRSASGHATAGVEALPPLSSHLGAFPMLASGSLTVPQAPGTVGAEVVTPAEPEPGLVPEPEPGAEAGAAAARGRGARVGAGRRAGRRTPRRSRTPSRRPKPRRSRDAEPTAQRAAEPVAEPDGVPQDTEDAA